MALIICVYVRKYVYVVSYFNIFVNKKKLPIFVSLFNGKL